jgi:RNA recognition motif-containing protein
MASSRMLVTDFDRSTSEEELKELFSVHGRVRHVEIVGIRGLGFVEMYNKSEAKKAVLALNGFEFKDSTLKVQEARPFGSRERERTRPSKRGGRKRNRRG